MHASLGYQAASDVPSPPPGKPSARRVTDSQEMQLQTDEERKARFAKRVKRSASSISSPTSSPQFKRHARSSLPETEAHPKSQRSIHVAG
jgi:hypothetical protein